MTVHNEDFDLKTFLLKLDFNEECIQGYARYLCTQGNKEDEFSFLLAKRLDEFLSHAHPDLYTVLQYNERAMKENYEEINTGVNESFGYSKGSPGLYSDIAIINSEDDVTDIIELKTNRHSAYVYDYIKSNGQDLSKILENVFWREKTLGDVSKLLEKKKHFPNIRFWCGTLLYSLERKTESPKKYGRYLKNDQAQRLSDSQPLNLNDLDTECQKKCDAFASALMKIKSMIPDTNISREGECVKIDLKEEDLIHKIIARGIHRDVLVRSDLILFEVK
jgi:hypothetical protein